MDLRQKMLNEIAIGVGCKKGAGAAAVIELLRTTLDDAPSFGRATMFTVARKFGEPGLREAADYLGFEIVFLDETEFLARQDEFLQRGAAPSRKAHELTGFSSIAEAAALMGGGPQAKLILRRRAADGVTCAVAGNEDTP
jgi:cobalt-precorrin 5A hydrolase